MFEFLKLYLKCFLKEETYNNYNKYRIIHCMNYNHE